MANPASKIGTLLRWACIGCLIGGGGLWGLSPMGVHLSELMFRTPDAFWNLFPSSPTLLFIGLIGLHL